MFVLRTNHNASSTPAWAAVADAEAISAINAPTFSSADKFKAELVERLVVSTFYKSDVYKNFRKGFIAIKVCDPSAEELISDECRKLYDACHANDIEVVHTKTGVIFRVYPIV